jgi:hypothetical protein
LSHPAQAGYAAVVKGSIWFALLLVVDGGVVGCGHRQRAPRTTYTAAPSSAPTGPSAPACTDQPVQNGSVITGDVVTCEGSYAVALPDLKQAGMTQAARYALLAGRTHLLVIGETNELTPGQTSAVECVQSEKDARRAKKKHASAEAPAGTVDPNGGTSPPPTVNGKNCHGGEPIPGTEGHVLHLSVSFLSATEATSVPNAVNASELLGMSAPAPAPGPAGYPRTQ